MIHLLSKLTVYIINCGSANNIQINSVFLYNSSHNIVGVYSSNSADSISALKPINSGVPIPHNFESECWERMLLHIMEGHIRKRHLSFIRFNLHYSLNN